MVRKHVASALKLTKGPRHRSAKNKSMLCHYLAQLLLHTNAGWVMQVPLRSNAIAVHAPSLRAALGSRVTAGEVEEAMRTLYTWKVFLTYAYSSDMFVVTLNPPRGFKPHSHDELARPPVTFPALADLAGGKGARQRRKAQVMEMAVSRMTKEAAQHE